MLADAVIASRNGRNVLPAKIPIATGLKGGPRYLRASGNTVYIEPRSVSQS